MTPRRIMSHRVDGPPKVPLPSIAHQLLQAHYLTHRSIDGVDCFDLLRCRMEADSGAHGRREFIKTLRLLETIPLAALTPAIERALEIDVLAEPTLDGLRLPSVHLPLRQPF